MSICKDEYQKAITKRQKHPLPSGEYKLREAADRLDRYEQEIHLLAKCLRLGAPLRGMATYGDHAPWLKKMPKEIADLLGYYVLPAIRKLAADGVSPTVLQQKLPWFDKEISGVVDQCEASLRIMKCGIKYEYDRWKNGDSALLPLIQEAQAIVDAAQNMLPPTGGTGIKTAEKDTHKPQSSMR